MSSSVTTDNVVYDIGHLVASYSSKKSWWNPPPWYVYDVKARTGPPKAKRLEPNGKIVGPEPDWFVLNARIPFEELRRFFNICEFSHMSALFPRNGRYTSPKGCLHTSGMEIPHILAWTRWANTVGVRYNGTNGYIFPKGNTDEKPRLRLVVHKRKSKKDKRGLRLPGAPIKAHKISAKKMRKIWFHSKPRGPFKDFVANFDREYFSVGETGVPAPRIVLDSLKVIYSRRVEMTEVQFVPAPMRVLTPRMEKRRAKAAKTEAYNNRLQVIARERSRLFSMMEDVKCMTDVAYFNRLNSDMIYLDQEESLLDAHGPEVSVDLGFVKLDKPIIAK